MSKKTWKPVLTTLLAATMLLGGCGATGSFLGADRGGDMAALAAKKKAKGGFTPAWVKDAVFYQIFPERFANGDKSNDPIKSTPWGGKPENFNYFGGDLAGVKGKLPYIKSLGINAIYFNPLFEADSNHKYNTTDYMKIDPSFGTNAQFKSLIAECHSMGIKVIIDGVFNHTGDKHHFFQDAMKKGPESKYWDFYKIWGFPVVQSPKPNYNSWWGFGTLPQLQAAHNRKVQEYLFEVTEFWTKQGIDGWRLDVPNEIDNRNFWREWRGKVRAINPEAYIVGEIWDDGSSWLQGDQFDAVMNYQGRDMSLDFFAHQKTSVDDFDARLGELRHRYGQEVTEASFNILSSHDVPRILTEAGGDKRRAKEATFFQMVYPGAPVVYYGDELGMAGAKDPDNRRTMPWEGTRDNDMLAFTQKMIKLRKAHPALRGGEFKTLMRHNHFRQFVFLRADKGEKLVVAMNSGTETRDMTFAVTDFAEGTALVDHMTGKRYKVQGGKVLLNAVPAQTGAILGPVS